MSMPEPQAKFQAAIETALEEYMRAVSEELQDTSGEFLVDWVVGYTKARMDDEGEMAWQNAMITKHGVNPNGHVALASWTADVVSEILMIGVSEDFDEG